MTPPNHDPATLEAVLEALPEPVLVIDEHGRYLDVLGAARPDQNSLIGKHLADVLPQEVAGRFLAAIRGALDENAPRVQQYCVNGGGGDQWFEARVTPIRSASGEPRRVAWMAADITQHKQLEQQLRQSSLVDPLTEAASQYQFNRSLEQEIRREHRYKEPFCLLLLELDHFGAIAENYGAEVGDGCLRETARLIRQELRHSDVLARMEGEQFGILLVNTPINWGHEVGERIRVRISRLPYALPKRTLHLSVSGGVTDFRNGDTAGKMLSRADLALVKSKNAGHDRISVG